MDEWNSLVPPPPETHLVRISQIEEKSCSRSLIPSTQQCIPSEELIHKKQGKTSQHTKSNSANHSLQSMQFVFIRSLPGALPSHYIMSPARHWQSWFYFFLVVVEKKRENMQVKPIMIHQSTAQVSKVPSPSIRSPGQFHCCNFVGEHELRKIMEKRWCACAKEPCLVTVGSQLLLGLVISLCARLGLW